MPTAQFTRFAPQTVHADCSRTWYPLLPTNDSPRRAGNGAGIGHSSLMLRHRSAVSTAWVGEWSMIGAYVSDDRCRVVCNKAARPTTNGSSSHSDCFRYLA